MRDLRVDAEGSTNMAKASRRNLQRVMALLSQVKFDDPNDGEWEIQVRYSAERGVRFRIGHERRNLDTGEMGWGFGGWYVASEYATDSEIVQACFGLFKAYVEHECREAFHWKGRRIFGPHISIDALYEAAEHTDERKN